ncbi:hypothetical protein E2C01_085709 [Portunus trituberculatus]|uniref:Uncharacterized protein n=1 Tax=Portunus trituberculatus TaxID=210409 RepID=A0A5B7J3H3_PORTR|nr:hypothetical protein [Portunus trituberculatus]
MVYQWMPCLMDYFSHKNSTRPIRVCVYSGNTCNGRGPLPPPPPPRERTMVMFLWEEEAEALCSLPPPPIELPP